MLLSTLCDKTNGHGGNGRVPPPLDHTVSSQLFEFRHAQAE